MIAPPTITPPASKRTVMSLPKRDELLLRSVLALPSASMSGFACRICCSSEPAAAAAPAAAPAPALALLAPLARFETSAMNWSMSLVFSDLPAPLSPEMTMLWSARPASIAECASAATAYTCGGLPAEEPPAR